MDSACFIPRARKASPMESKSTTERITRYLRSVKAEFLWDENQLVREPRGMNVFHWNALGRNRPLLNHHTVIIIRDLLDADRTTALVERGRPSFCYHRWIAVAERP